MSLPLVVAWRNGLPLRAVMIWDASPEWENRFASIPNRTRDFEMAPSAGVCSWTTGARSTQIPFLSLRPPLGTYSSTASWWAGNLPFCRC
jgi:hypothetical protein